MCVFVPICLFRDLDSYAEYRLLTDILMFICCGWIIGIAVSSILSNGPAPDIVLVNVKGQFTFVGLTLCVFENIGLIMPVQVLTY